MTNQSNNNRRQFIKKGITSATLASIIPASLSGSQNTVDTSTLDEKITFRTLGKTGLKVPIVSMGTGDTSNPKLVKAAIDKGVKLLATSQYYGKGNNEKMIGKVIKDCKRDDILVMTSAMPDGVDHKEGLFTDINKEGSYLAKLNDSLERIEVDYVDIFILPFAARRESVFFEPLLKDMEKAKKQGKAKFIGIATHKYESEAIKAAVETNVYDVVMTAFNFKQEKHRDTIKAIDYAAEKGIGIIAMKTMAGAYWDKEKTIPINTKAALKWVLQHKNVHTTVPGFTAFDQMEQDIALMRDFELTEEEKADLKLALNKSKTGIYCQQCGKCIHQCNEGLDIPNIMRSYMYAYGYGNYKHAKESIAYTGISGIMCENCDVCSVTCPSGFDIKGKIQDIARISNVPDDFLRKV